MDLWAASAADLVRLYRQGDASPPDVLAALLARIERHDRDLGCFLGLSPIEAEAAALASAERYRRGQPLSDLDGVPVALKDNLCRRGQRVSAGLRMLENHVASYDAEVVSRLAAAGALIVGRTNMDEFGMGSSSERSAFRPVRNPWDRRRVPGGSSGGSAAAVAAGLVPLALGSDTGGSVRQPAALCGVVGLRPTYGTVSRRGLIAFASSLDQIGPLARSTEDAAALLQVIAGFDPLDPTSLSGSRPDYRGEIERGAAGIRLGVPREYLSPAVEAEVAAAVTAAVALLEGQGARAAAVSLPHTGHGIATYYLLANAEASSNLARFDGVRYGLRVAGDDLLTMYSRTRRRGFGPEVKRRILLGTYALSAGYYDAYYRRALLARERIRADFAAAFAVADVLVTPAAPGVAFALGARVQDPVAMYLSDVFTVPSALAGIPGLVVPFGFSAERLPLAVQLLGRPGEEATLFRVGRAIEALRPPLPAIAPLPVALTGRSL